MSPNRLPTWQHTDTGLLVQIGQRGDRLPDPIGDWLIGPGGLGLTDDPARDLLRVEGRLRHVIAQLSAEIITAEQRISALRGDGTQAGTARRRRRRADAEHRTALHAQAELVDSRERAHTVLQILRTFVMELDAPHGLLREAAQGWRRRSDPPPSVVVFDDESTFLDANPRRGTTSGWGGVTIAGTEEFGLTWRRDGDEAVDDPTTSTPDDEPQRTGPWQLGYIVNTAEVYAIRRCGYLPQQVWLLGRGFDAPSVVHDVLRPIMPRITEPNSVILAAGTVHSARIWPPATTPALPHDRTDSPMWTPAHMPEETGR